MEHAITEAYESVQEIEKYVAWDRADDHPQGFTPPGWLCLIEFHLYDASLKATEAPILFYGERLAVPDEVALPEPQETEAIQ